MNKKFLDRVKPFDPTEQGITLAGSSEDASGMLIMALCVELEEADAHCHALGKPREDCRPCLLLSAVQIRRVDRGRQAMPGKGGNA